MKHESGTPFSSQDHRPLREGRTTQNSAVRDLRGYFLMEVRSALNGERALANVITDIVPTVTSHSLSETLQHYRQWLQIFIARLENAFSRLEGSREAGHYDILEAWIREAEGLQTLLPAGAVRDAATIMAFQRIQHLKITNYGTLSAFAEVLGEGLMATLLTEALDKEKQADCVLTAIAFSTVNQQAANYRHPEGVTVPR